MPDRSRAYRLIATLGLGLVLAAGGLGLRLSAQAAQVATVGTELSGSWSLDRDASEFPKELGFGANFLPFGRGGDAQGGGGGRRGGRGGNASAGGLQPALRPQGESYDEAQRREHLTDEVRNPPSRLTVVDTPDMVTFSDEQGSVRTLHPDGRAETLQLDGSSVLVVARRDAASLIVLYAVADLRQLRYTYSRLEGTGSLVVDVEFVERGQVGDKVRRVYTSGDAQKLTGTAAAGGANAPAGSAPGAAPGTTVPRAGSEFSGLKRIGVVVEDLSTQSVSCGVKKDGLEAVVSKAFTEAGLKASTNSDEDTYVHVTIMTSTMPTGMCISRYDWSIYAMTDATLSYQRSPLLVQVLLAHKGGLTGSLPATHGDDVARGIQAGVAQIATIIHDANK